MVEWTVEDVYHWAQKIIKEQYAKKLLDEEMNGQALARATIEKLQTIKIPLGPAENLMVAIEELSPNSGSVFYILPISLFTFYLCSLFFDYSAVVEKIEEEYKRQLAKKDEQIEQLSVQVGILWGILSVLMF